MPNFNNRAYDALLHDLLNDAFYLADRSPRGKASTIRQYAEVIIRKLLDIPDGQYFTLGSSKTTKELIARSSNDSLLISSVNKINTVGSKFIHTEVLEAATEQDVQEMVLALFDLYAYLFIDYFRRNPFGSNERITSAFSILPPIVRYLTLRSLYSHDNKNVNVIDKLSLAILKAFDEQAALKWLDDRKDQLSTLSAISEKAESDAREKFGPAIAKKLVDDALNMFDLCSGRVRTTAKTIEEHGRLYYDFESAIEFYKVAGKVNGESDDVREFNSIMEFVYLGRKPTLSDVKRNPGDYLTIE
jgi:hypothetical protein